MKGSNINDWPEQYRNQIRAQLAANSTKHSVTKQKHTEQSSLECQIGTPQGMVNSNRPLFVRITRIGGRLLDDDNLSGGCKELRDAIAAAFGRKGDSEKDGFRWEYAQTNGH